jgi:hypothetical protein
VRVYTGELTVTVWGWAQFGMVIWNFCALKDYSTVAWLALWRTLCNIMPGQCFRFLFVPDIQEATYFIPAIIGEAMIVVGNLGSCAIAIAELIELKDVSHKIPAQREPEQVSFST